jgi:hypothetical protein
MRLLARDVEDCRFSKIQIIVADSVRAEGGRRPVCLRASRQLARSVVVPSRRACRSTVGVSVARSVGTPTLEPIRPVANSWTSGIPELGRFFRVNPMHGRSLLSAHTVLYIFSTRLEGECHH